MIEKFKRIFELQEEAKEKYSTRVRNLLERTTQLEKQSWDRADAKENFGSVENP